MQESIKKWQGGGRKEQALESRMKVSSAPHTEEEKQTKKPHKNPTNQRQQQQQKKPKKQKKQTNKKNAGKKTTKKPKYKMRKTSKFALQVKRK